MLCGIGQKALRFHLRRQFLKAGLTGGEQVTIEFVESVIYRYLSTATAGVDFNKDICFRKAHLPGTKASEWCRVAPGTSSGK